MYKPALTGITAASLLATTLIVTQAFACACCSDPGERFEGMIEIEPFIKDELNLIQPSGSASLYQTACGFECVEGIETPADDYSVGLVRDGDEWKFSFTAVAGESGGAGSGAVSLVIPDALERFAVDPEPQAGQPSVTLYKEWRLTSPIEGSGVFAGGADGATVTLILSGRGNSCDGAYSFTHWWLDVTGPKARYRLFGMLEPQ